MADTKADPKTEIPEPETPLRGPYSDWKGPYEPDVLTPTAEKKKPDPDEKTARVPEGRR